MPLETRILTLRKKDVEKHLAGCALRYKTSYVPITQHGYGRMDASTPGIGLATDTVASCSVVVLHCPSTGRTTVLHTPNFLYMPTLLPMVDWITGGLVKSPISRKDQHLVSPCQVQAAILRGWAYANPEARNWRHTEWMNDFRGLFTPFIEHGRISLDVFDSRRLLTTGAVLVDKVSAKITYLELAHNIKRPTLGLKLYNPSLPEQYSDAQMAQDLFVATLLGIGHLPEGAPIFLQYDVDKYCLPLPLTSEARELLRSKRSGQPPASQSAIIQKYGLSEDWISRTSNLDFNLMNSVFSDAAQSHACELCANAGSKICGACKGAWYCGDIHQKKDWKSHKSWCKSHTL